MCAEILGNDFKIDNKYSYKKVQKWSDYIEYEVDHKNCDAVTFKQHFIIISS